MENGGSCANKCTGSFQSLDRSTRPGRLEAGLDVVNCSQDTGVRNQRKCLRNSKNIPEEGENHFLRSYHHHLMFFPRCHLHPHPPAPLLRSMSPSPGPTSSSCWPTWTLKRLHFPPLRFHLSLRQWMSLALPIPPNFTVRFSRGLPLIRKNLISKPNQNLPSHCKIWQGPQKICQNLPSLQS
jgi:hypothetical protein